MFRASEKAIHLGQNLPEPELLHRRATSRWYREYLFSLGPVAYWPMQDPSGLPVDVSGNGNDMTAVNGTPTYLNSGPFLNPSIGYPSGAYHERAVVSTQTNDFMVCFWVYRDGSLTTTADLFTHGTTSGGFQIEWTGTSGNTRGNVPGVGTLGNIGVIPSQTWTFFVCGKNTGSGGSWPSGINGGYSSIGTANTATPTGNSRLSGFAATEVRYSHFAFFNRALTANEVMALYLIGQKVVIPL